MTLLDTNVIVDYQDSRSPFHAWAAHVIETEGAIDGVAISPITLAELISGGGDATDLQESLQNAFIAIVDLPKDSARICGLAYRRYHAARKRSRGGSAPLTPLPDFFIGAHAESLGCKLATRDVQRFKTYFPKVIIIQP